MKDQIKNLIKQAKRLNQEIDDLNTIANSILKGKKIRITHEHFNWQPYGHSWPKLKGKTFIIDHVIIYQGRIDVWFRGPEHYTYMPIDYGVLEESN